MKRSLSFLLLIAAAVLLSSCSSFEQEWQQSVADYEAGKISAPYGPWEGSWTTSSNGHTGGLRAVVKEKSGTNEATFRYHATWAEHLKGGYQVSFPVVRQGSTYIVNGSKNLGLFGTFNHKGKVTGNQFRATYSSNKGDLGEFRMRRP
ncbi:MAG: hypothetical protein AAGA96_17575 [Verrucomicrobiota bacterium]